MGQQAGEEKKEESNRTPQKSKRGDSMWNQMTALRFQGQHQQK